MFLVLIRTGQKYVFYMHNNEVLFKCFAGIPITPINQGRGDGLEVESMSRNPEGRGSIPRLGSRRSSLISIEHAELLRSTPSLVQCCVWLVTMALHVYCGLGQLSPLPTSGDDK